jgi:hypothetical protein
VPQDDQTNNNSSEANKQDNSPPQATVRTKPSGLRLIIVAGCILTFTLLFISVYLPNLTARVKFFTVNFLSLLVLAAIAVQAYIYKRQWDAMQGQLSVMQELKDITDRQSDKMQGQLDAINKQARIIEQELLRSHRPWVSLGGNPIVRAPLVSEGDGFYVDVIFNLRNTGNSAAIGTVVVASLIRLKKWEDRPLEERLDVQECEEIELRRLADIEGNLLIPQSGIDLPKRIHSRKNAPTTSDGAQVFLIACIGYIDEFGNGHATSIVERYIPESSLTSPRFETVGWGNAR